MTEHDANKPSLSRIYRQFAGTAPLRAVPEADDVLALARIDHADEAAAPLNADLLRFARALEPASAQLGADVHAAFRETAPATHRHAAVRRNAAAARRWRGVAAIAASVLAVVGVWTLQRGQQPAAPRAVAHAQDAANASDRIFSFDERSVASISGRDEIFHGTFSQAPTGDVIFRYHDG